MARGPGTDIARLHVPADRLRRLATGDGGDDAGTGSELQQGRVERLAAQLFVDCQHGPLAGIERRRPRCRCPCWRHRRRRRCAAGACGPRRRSPAGHSRPGPACPGKPGLASPPMQMRMLSASLGFGREDRTILAASGFGAPGRAAAVLSLLVSPALESDRHHRMMKDDTFVTRGTDFFRDGQQHVIVDIDRRTFAPGRAARRWPCCRRRSRRRGRRARAAGRRAPGTDNRGR